MIYHKKGRKGGRNERKIRKPDNFVVLHKNANALPIMFDGDSRTMLLHHALGINDVRRTELQNGIEFFLKSHFEKIFLPFSLIDFRILHLLIQIYVYIHIIL